MSKQLCRSGRMLLLQQGFTLVELIITMAILAVVAAIVVQPLSQPFKNFMEITRRAELSDAANSTLRRLERDVHEALPNSLRQPSSTCLEYLPIIAGGRYRANLSSTNSGDILDFTGVDNRFDVLTGFGLSGLPNGSRLVIYNLGIRGANAYDLDNTAFIATGASNASSITLIQSKLFPFASPGQRFQVIPNESRVYACVNLGQDAEGNGTGVLVRYARSLGNTALPALNNCPVSTSELPSGYITLGQSLSQCTINYGTGVYQRDAVLQVNLGLSKQETAIQLRHEAHIENVP